MLRIASCLAVLLLVIPVAAAPQRAAEPPSTEAMAQWLNVFRTRPNLEALPLIMVTLSKRQAFKDPETTGAYVGFIAGVIGSHPERAEELIAKMLPIAPADHWVLVRAIAYSGLPDWKRLLATFADRMPTRRVMINEYLDGKLPTLDQIAYDKDSGAFDKIKAAFRLGKPTKRGVALDPSPELIDTLWGYYLATGAYAPIARIIKLLPLANDKDNVDKLTTGSAAKYTLASNAMRDPELLDMLRFAARSQPKEVAVVLNEVVEAAETVDTARMRKEALAAIEEIKQKGSLTKRNLTTWGQIGEGALSMGCIVAAATGQIEFGLPCVIGGAATSATLYYLGK